MTPFPLLRRFLFSVLILVSASAVIAQDCVHYEDMIHFVGMLPDDDDWSYVNDMEAHDEYVYACYYGIGLAVVDIHDRANPVIVGSWDEASDVTHALWHEGLLLLVDEYEGLYILDLGDPVNPVTLSNVPVLGYELINVGARGNLALLSENDALRIIDISVPETPVPRGTLPLPSSPHGVSFDPTDPSLVYVAEEDEGVIVVDLINPDAPIQMGQVNWAGSSAQDVKFSGGHLFVADYDNGLVVLQANGATDPTYLGAHSFGDGYGYPSEIEVGGGHAFMSGDYVGTVAFDIGDPLMPAHVATLGADSGIYRIDLSGDYLYVAVDGSGMDIYDVANPDFQAPTGALGVAIDGVVFDADLPRLFLADSGGDLHAIHWETQNVVGNLEFSGFVNDLDHREGVLYVGNTTLGLLMVNCSDPMNMILEGTWPETGPPIDSTVEDIGIQGHDLYVLLDDHGLRKFYIDDPFYPDPLGIGGALHDYDYLTLYSDYAYAAGWDTSWNAAIEVFDISNYEAPVSLGTLPSFESLQAIHAEDGRLYCLSDDVGLLVYDLYDPALPVLMGVEPFPTMQYGYGLDAEGSFVYAGTSSNNFYEDASTWIFDVSQADDPRCLGALGEQYDTDFILQIGNQIWTTHPDEGLVVYPVQCEDLVTGIETPGADRLGLEVYPNPFNPKTLIEYRLERESFVELEIFDVSGRKVRSLARGVQEAGLHSREWDGRDEAGNRLASGMYLARIKSGDLVGDAKLILLK